VVSVAPEVKENLIKAYVVSGNAHSSALPNVPSAKQVGIPKFQLSTWGAIFTPKGTPKDIVAKLSGALDKALDDPAVAKRLVDQGRSRPGAFCKDAQGGHRALGSGAQGCDAGAEITVALNPWPEFPRLRRDGPRALTGCRHE
jgi:hypothetical protein